MKKCLPIFAVLIVINSLELINAAPKPDVRVRERRSFRLIAYFDNYFDKIANSACVAMGTKDGLYFATHRECNARKTVQSCFAICTSYTIRKQAQIWDPTKLLNTECVKSLHLYKQRPSLAETKNQDADVNKVGMTIYRYKSCHTTGCGPNYCCCTGLPN